MDFLEIANARQSCRAYEAGREVEQEKLDILCFQLFPQLAIMRDKWHQ